MRRTFKIVVLLLCFMTPEIDAAQANSSSQPFAVSITANNAQVKAGSNVCVRVTLTNTSSVDLAMKGGASAPTGLDPNYRFEVRYQGGGLIQKKAYPHPEIFRAARYNYLLKPGESHTQDECPSASYDMRTPGQYTIQAFRPTSGPSSGGEIASNIVNVTVLPAVSAGQAFDIVIAPVVPVVKAGSKICVQINLVNSSRDLAISHVSVNGLDAQFRYEIRDEGGNLLPQKAWPYPVRISPHGNSTLGKRRFERGTVSEHAVRHEQAREIYDSSVSAKIKCPDGWRDRFQYRHCDGRTLISEDGQCDLPLLY